jgi:GNAT superfamily N-acetyltransferase
MAIVRVRQAVPQDRDRVFEMGLSFHGQTVYARGVQDAESVQQSLLNLIDLLMGRDNVLLIAETWQEADAPVAVGLIVTPHIFNRSRLFAHEVAWWVEPGERSAGAGRALLVEAERRAREVGAAGIQMLALNGGPTAVLRLYAEAGYQSTEHAFTKFFD